MLVRVLFNTQNIVFCLNTGNHRNVIHLTDKIEDSSPVTPDGICSIRGRKEANHNLRTRGTETSIQLGNCVLNLESASYGYRLQTKKICAVSH